MKSFAIFAFLLIGSAIIVHCEMEGDGDGHNFHPSHKHHHQPHHKHHQPHKQHHQPHRPQPKQYYPPPSYFVPPKCPADQKCTPDDYAKKCPTSDVQYAKGSVCQGVKEKFDDACDRAVAQAEKDCVDRLDCSCSPHECFVRDNRFYGFYAGYGKKDETCVDYCDIKGKKCAASVAVKRDVRVFPPVGRKYEPVCQRVYDKRCPSYYRVETRDASKCTALCGGHTCQCY